MEHCTIEDAQRRAQVAAPAAPPLFSLREAQVVRAGRTILNVERFDLAEGEHVALLGPNGAGKSTFIQLLTREIFPLHRDEPPVRFRGQARPVLADIKQALGIVSATMHDQVRVHLPVREIVAGGLFGSLGLPLRAEIDDTVMPRALEALDRLDIVDLAERDVTTLSTGQVRRVLVARELISDPKVLIFDEPCTGLDPEGMYHVRDTMRVLAEEGRSVVLVTHYPEDIIPAIGRVLLIKDAEVFADGPKAELLTSDEMTALFGVSLEVTEHNGWYALSGRYEHDGNTA